MRDYVVEHLGDREAVLIVDDTGFLKKGVDEVDPDGARFRRTSHDDVAFVGQVSEYLA
ncbi:hypothetical protein GCM10009574_099580 [Streptomyces asiaticus]|uniref:Transposase IS701-like DDE domain-containing protein n=2 Tax=Streptomyces rhizosphaericus TaxID=114699 RepID=A0ABP4D7I3_9ACTN